MDPDYRGFKASYPLKVSDLSGISHDRRTSRPGTENSLSSRSSEFLVALEEFSSMKISKMEAQEKETKNCVDETAEKFVQRRPSLSDCLLPQICQWEYLRLRIEDVANLCHHSDLLQWIFNTAFPLRIPDRMAAMRIWGVIQRRASYTELMKFLRLNRIPFTLKGR